jgi:glycosyltransferase involved in cell wall biosynthesis
VYAGRLAPHRELEVLAAASEGSPVPITLIGPADETWLAGFDARAARVRPPITADEVTGLLQDAGIALVTHGDAFANLRLALPNKLFQAVAAGVPVVATDVGSMAEVVRAHGLGTLYRRGDVGAFRTALRELLEDYPQWCAKVDQARRSLTWAADAERLVALYERMQ